jgi:predicted metal-dependent hydrolase
MKYKINPNFRLSTRYLSVAWHIVDRDVIAFEAAIAREGRFVYTFRKAAHVIVQWYIGQVDIIYHKDTDFEAASLQKWLRATIRGIILSRAQEILPERVRYWEEKTGLHGKGVKVHRFTKKWLGYCTGDNEIHLQPFLVIFKQEWMDGVILHEMAHYKHKHHRKAFWDFLSSLANYDSVLVDAKHQAAMAPYYEYYVYLTAQR